MPFINVFTVLGEKSVPMVRKEIILGVIYEPNSGRVLIGRRENDPFVPNLTWCFPGGEVKEGRDTKAELIQHVKMKTGVDIEIIGVVDVRTPPENPELHITYLYCQPVGGKEEPGGSFVQLGWVKPSEAKYFFTSSLDARLDKFLVAIEKSGGRLIHGDSGAA